MSINADELALLLYIGDNVVDGNLCCGSCSGRNCDDRYAGILGRSYALERTNVGKLGVSDNDTDSLGGIHRGTAADSNDALSAGSLELLNTVLYVLNGRVGLDIGIKSIFNAGSLKEVSYLLGYAELDEIGVGRDKCFLKAAILDLLRYSLDGACAMVRRFVERKLVHFIHQTFLFLLCSFSESEHLACSSEDVSFAYFFRKVQLYYSQHVAKCL